MRVQPVSGNGGAAPEKRTCRLINRTGATLTRGDLVALNLDFAATSGQAMVGLTPSNNADSSAGWIFGAAIAVTTENMFRVCLPFESGPGGANTCADNEEGVFVTEGICDLKMNGANAGEILTGTNAQVYATPLTLTEVAALTATGKFFGYALEATSGAAVGKAVWNAWCGVGAWGGDT